VGGDATREYEGELYFMFLPGVMTNDGAGKEEEDTIDQLRAIRRSKQQNIS
jgi:hypothetical protein